MLHTSVSADHYIVQRYHAPQSVLHSLYYFSKLREVLLVFVSAVSTAISSFSSSWDGDEVSLMAMEANQPHKSPRAAHSISARKEATMLRQHTKMLLALPWSIIHHWDTQLDL
jgi:hypothetical protein